MRSVGVADTLSNLVPCQLQDLVPKFRALLSLNILDLKNVCTIVIAEKEPLYLAGSRV